MNPKRSKTARRTGTSICLLTVLLSSSPAALAQDIKERFATGPDANVDLSNVSGAIYITGWDEKEVSITGELDDNAEIELTHDDNKVGVKVVKKPGAHRMGKTTLKLQVPFASTLSVYAVSSDLTVDKVSGAMQLEVVSGDVSVSGFERDLRVKSVSGDVALRGRQKSARLSVVSVSGDTNVRGAGGDLEATSVSGDTRIEGGDFDQVRVQSTSGRVEFAGKLNSAGRLDLEAISGNVVIELEGKEDLDVEAETFSGSISNCLGEKSIRKSEHGPGELLRFSRGAADQDVRVRSLSGNVKICAR